MNQFVDSHLEVASQKSKNYPTPFWTTYDSPESVGWSTDKLFVAQDYFNALDSSAVVVIYKGKVLLAWGNVKEKYEIWSIRKSILSALFGIFHARGQIDLDKTLEALNIDDVTPLTANEKRAKVSDLLKARSGIYLPAADQDPPSRSPERGACEPGEKWLYNNWDFNALATIFEQETGEQIFEAFQREIAVPIGMEDFDLCDGRYHYEREKSVHPSYRFRMTARDLARFGLLFLREGDWHGKQIIPKSWILESTCPYSDVFVELDGQVGAYNRTKGYGYMWWSEMRGPLSDLGWFAGLGTGINTVEVLPHIDLVFVHRTPNCTDDDPLVSNEQAQRLLCMILTANPQFLPFALQQELEAIINRH